MFPKVEEQVVDLVREKEQRAFRYTTENSYGFEIVSYPLGDATVTSETTGTVQINGKCLIIDAEIKYEFIDTFTDPASLRQWDPFILTSNVNHPKFAENKWTEFNGTYFDITDAWATKMSGIIQRKIK